MISLMILHLPGESSQTLSRWNLPSSVPVETATGCRTLDSSLLALFTVLLRGKDFASV